MKIKIYTDGCCLGNPGRGGYCVLVIDDDNNKIIKKISGGNSFTTNNQMELTALLQALIYIEDTFTNEKDKPEITIVSDSEYVVHPITLGWIYGWKNKNWRKTGGRVKNTHLWIPILDTYTKCSKIANINFQLVRGHTGVFYNELCDKYSKEEAEKS